MQSKPTHKARLPAFMIRKAAVLAPADPRTITKLLRGEPVSPLARERIMRALQELGVDNLVDAEAAR